jgi:hypothetical protein
MDTDNLIAHARARFDHAQARKILKEKYQAKMIFAYAGGMWQAGPELLSTLKFCRPDSEVVLLDSYNNPVKIQVQELWNLTSERWQEQMNAWLIEYEELGKKR